MREHVIGLAATESFQPAGGVTGKFIAGVITHCVVFIVMKFHVKSMFLVVTPVDGWLHIDGLSQFVQNVLRL